MNKKYYSTKEEWNEIRNSLIAEGRIGGSMVGTVAGVDPWKSPYTLWAELTGRIEREDISGREAIVVGTDLEDYVAERFCRLTGKKVHRENCIMTNDCYPHLFASIDRKVSNEESGLECKTASAFRDGAFADGKFPDGYYRQVKTYLAVTGLDRWYLAVLVMGVAFRVFLITTHREDLDNLPEYVSGARFVDDMELIECEQDASEFRHLVETDTPPAMTGAEDERRSINFVSGCVSSGSCELSASIDELIERRAELKKQGDDNSAEIKRIENEIISALGGAEQGVSASWKVSYKYGDTKRLDKDLVAAKFGGKIPDDCFKVTHSPTLRINPVKKNFK